jgi:hypothetical protein
MHLTTVAHATEAQVTWCVVHRHHFANLLDAYGKSSNRSQLCVKASNLIFPHNSIGLTADGCRYNRAGLSLDDVILIERLQTPESQQNVYDQLLSSAITTSHQINVVDVSQDYIPKDIINTHLQEAFVMKTENKADYECNLVESEFEGEEVNESSNGQNDEVNNNLLFVL